MYNNGVININRLSVTNYYDCILAMLLGSSRNGILEVTQFSIPTTSGTASVIRRNLKRNTSGLTAPGSLTLAPCVKGRGGFLTCPTVIQWYPGPPSLGLDPKDPAILRLEACWRLFINLAQLGLDLPTSWLAVQASSNCATLTPSPVL